jgi:hypothetical protein
MDHFVSAFMTYLVDQVRKTPPPPPNVKVIVRSWGDFRKALAEVVGGGGDLLDIRWKHDEYCQRLERLWGGK